MLEELCYTFQRDSLQIRRRCEHDFLGSGNGHGTQLIKIIGDIEVCIDFKILKVKVATKI